MKVKAGNRLYMRYWITDTRQASRIVHRELCIQQRFFFFAFCFLTSLISLAVASDQSGQVSASTQEIVESSRDANSPKMPVANESSQNNLNITSKPVSEVTNKLQQNGVNVQKGKEIEWDKPHIGDWLAYKLEHTSRVSPG